MRKSAVYTAFNPYTVLLLISMVARTFLIIKGAVTEKTVKLLKSLMTRIVLAIPVFKKPA